LYAFPPSTVGSRKYKTQPISIEVADVFTRLCEDMLNIQKKEPGLLILDEHSEAISERFYNELEPRLGKDGDLEHMADWAGKLHGAVLRLAGLMQVVHGVWDEEDKFADFPFEIIITEETMRCAIEIGKYFLAHAIACYGIFGANEAERGAAYILERLKKYNALQFTAREILRLCKRFKTAADLTEPLAVLVEHGFIREIKADYTGMGRPPGNLYQVNPKIIST
jgi:hypothetical protein